MCSSPCRLSLMRHIPTPEPVTFTEAFVAKKEFARALGWLPKDVLKIEITANLIRVTTANREVYTMTTPLKTMTASEWVLTKSAPYSHAANLL